ncbi:MAG TPA: NADH-dependent alcohol dehydrogenase [Lentisphaeria bacterium]|nr:MAG: aldehyde reductase [Lentisphaerae bacterium GWF2_38_69]HBM15702.1 NADH-dependent alcohol dehydrogenase [Lentisphaeria bacterium]
MNNFVYFNPVKLIFGKGTITSLSEVLPKDKKIMLVYGGGSIKKNFVYSQIINSLKGFDFVEFAGIEPNPAYETCMKAVEIIKAQNVGFLLAAGGGSVLDAVKFIAAASKFDGDPWNILAEKAEIKSALPLGSVITLPATGSEMNAYSVISKKATNEKLAFYSQEIFPNFSIIDPEATYSLPIKQVINGLVDTFVHTVEQYVTFDVNSPLQDRQAEAILKTIVEISNDVINKQNDYESRANFFWCATSALNGVISCGVPQDWATHMIGHELTAFYGIDHAQSLAIVLPRVWKHNIEHKQSKLIQFGKRVFDIKGKDSKKTAQKAINKTEEFFQSLGIKTKLSDYGIDAKEAAEKISKRFKERNTKLGEKEQLTYKDIKNILKKC